jgi:hypothetical protein
MPTRAGYTLSFTVDNLEGTLITAADRDGHLQDVFLHVGKQGSTTAGLTEALATTLTVALHHGVPLPDLTTALPPGPLPTYLSHRLTTDFPLPTPAIAQAPPRRPPLPQHPPASGTDRIEG